MALPTNAEAQDLKLLSTEQLADHYGISTHALHMRLNRHGGGIPEPHHKMGRCLIWVLTQELAEELGIKA